MIRTLQEMEEMVLRQGGKHRIAVAWASDINTLGAISRAVKRGFAEALLIGRRSQIIETCKAAGIDSSHLQIIQCDNEDLAAEKAVAMAKSSEADVVMKGRVGTDKFLKAVMNREKGLMMPGAVLSYVCAIQLPSYHKLLFITDPAVIPIPDLDQKVAMAGYAVEMARKFGIDKPKVALISATEKVSRHFESSADYGEMCRMAAEGRIKNCIIDGPLDVFLACDSKSPEIKGVHTPVNGDADVLLFPSLESSNPFYKGLMLFAGGELAGLIRGTEKPVVVMSRSESEQSKYYCIALSCFMA